MQLINQNLRIRKYNPRAGQILIEVMIAISMSIVSLMGFFGLLRASFQLTRVTSENYIATHLAVEGVEIVANIMQRNYIDTIRTGSNLFNANMTQGSWEIDYNTQQIDFSTSRVTNKPLNFDGAHYVYGTGSPTQFYRVVDIGFEPASAPTQVSVTSTVFVDSPTNQPIANVHDVFYYWWR
ncbi:MAG: hypothetical protein M1320_00480 [Patescibacteria group bacterium]|nr:hypothetical protein [Patescibacteria group bacterium]